MGSNFAHGKHIHTKTAKHNFLGTEKDGRPKITGPGDGSLNPMKEAVSRACRFK